jgi:hypothetical protein
MMGWVAARKVWAMCASPDVANIAPEAMNNGLVAREQGSAVDHLGGPARSEIAMAARKVWPICAHTSHMHCRTGRDWPTVERITRHLIVRGEERQSPGREQ